MWSMEQGSLILIDKPAGMTSFGVVARIRRVLSEQQGKRAAGPDELTSSHCAMRKTVGLSHKRQRVKVGHTGTLDPFATGLMILVTGTECKNAGTYTKLDKVYEATICLGKTSTTGDPEGEITEGNTKKEISKKEIATVLQQFVGTITQTPPIFSAIKINGRRAYDLARKGEQVEMPQRTVTVYSLNLLDYTWPYLNIRTHVSSGTYIRTLAVDIGQKLGTGAYCTQLRRTRIADWDVASAKTLADFGVH